MIVLDIISNLLQLKCKKICDAVLNVFLEIFPKLLKISKIFPNYLKFDCWVPLLNSRNQSKVEEIKELTYF